WKDIIDNYELRILEDPFHEQDMENWFQLTNSQNKCRVIGDNFYSSDFKRIEEGAAKKYSDGVIIKPNQAGTVTSVEKAIETAKTSGQEIITSHRSISTESTFLSTLTCKNNVEYIKIGPLMTDYSSIVRLNEIIRYTEEPICHK
ncbi:MAG: enolase, partial [Anaerolineales bacterium]